MWAPTALKNLLAAVSKPKVPLFRWMNDFVKRNPMKVVRNHPLASVVVSYFFVFLLVLYAAIHFVVFILDYDEAPPELFLAAIGTTIALVSAIFTILALIIAVTQLRRALREPKVSLRFKKHEKNERHSISFDSGGVVDGACDAKTFDIEFYNDGELNATIYMVRISTTSPSAEANLHQWDHSKTNSHVTYEKTPWEECPIGVPTHCGQLWVMNKQRIQLEYLIYRTNGLDKGKLEVKDS